MCCCLPLLSSSSVPAAWLLCLYVSVRLSLCIMWHVQWGAFASTAMNKNTAQGFTNSYSGVIFKLTIHTGRDIARYVSAMMMMRPYEDVI